MKKDNYFLKIGIFFIFMFAIAFAFRLYYYDTSANSEKLEVKTSLNDNQAYHPKVISFDSEWNGYKYWMAYTPYPNKDETKENPEVNVSNDMITWETIIKDNKPLDVPNPSDSKHYNSDTHLLYNNDLDQIELFWRYVDDENNTVTIYKTTTKDGKKWTEKEVFLFSDSRSSKDYISPAIIYDNGTYKVWYVDKKAVHYLEIEDGIVSKSIELKIIYENDYKTWHLDVIYNEQKKLYEMITCAYENVNNRTNMNLYYTSSSDNINWSTPIVILKPSTNIQAWDSKGLYRASLLYEKGEYYLFYSGFDSRNIVGIGLMKGSNIEKLKAYSR